MDWFSVASGSAFSNVLKAKEDLQKSPEQLEQEKRSVLSQRVPTLQLDGKTKQDLIDKVLTHWSLFYAEVHHFVLLKAKQLHNLLQQLHGSIYELTERFERQKYDVRTSLKADGDLLRRISLLDGRIIGTCSSNRERVGDHSPFAAKDLHVDGIL